MSKKTSPIVPAFAKKAGKSEEEVKKMWEQAKSQAEKEGHKDDYQYIVGILKKMLKLNESSTFFDYLEEQRLIHLTEKDEVVKGTYDEWKKKLPDSVAHIDQSKDKTLSIAYKKEYDKDTDKEDDVEVGRYFHEENYGTIADTGR